MRACPVVFAGRGWTLQGDGDVDGWTWLGRRWDTEYGGHSQLTVLSVVLILFQFTEDFVPRHITYANSLDYYSAYYVSKFADHNSHEIAF